MSDDKYYLAWGTGGGGAGIALAAGTSKTIFELPTPSGVNAELAEIFIGCDAATAGSLRIELGTFTATGTGTAATPQKWTDTSVASRITGCKVADTAEPTGFSPGTLGALFYPSIVVPLPGYFPAQWPLFEGFAFLPSVNYALRLTASIACNTIGWAAWKE